MAADGDGFVTVTNKRTQKGPKAGHKLKVSPPNPMADRSPDELDESFDTNSFLKRLNSCKQDILLSDFFKESYDRLVSCLSKMCHTSGDRGSRTSLDTGHRQDKQSCGKDSTDFTQVHILSYGIGKFTSCLIARYQLAFLLALREKLGCETCEVYDPVFSVHEKAVLHACKCQVPTKNEEGKYSCTTETLAFLPHCGKALYNNLLWRNASSSNCSDLFKLLLIGNSFHNMMERTPSRVLEKTANFILKLQPFSSEVRLDNTFVHKDIFNDLAIHWFPYEKRHELIQRLIDDCKEPVYDDGDVEFIQAPCSTE